jgi:hypothetical protein
MQFLKFICTWTIEGKSADIHEQQIDIHVFDRSPTYVASDDSIIRTQARQLSLAESPLFAAIEWVREVCEI